MNQSPTCCIVRYLSEGGDEVDAGMDMALCTGGGFGEAVICSWEEGVAVL